MENTNNNPTTSDNGKTVAIVAYITLIGWIIALVMNSSNKTSLGGFHIRQALGLIIVAICVAIIRIPLFFIPFLGWGVGLALSIGVLIFWILGLVSAANSEEKPLPLIGDMFQNWFASIGK